MAKARSAVAPSPVRGAAAGSGRGRGPRGGKGKGARGPSVRPERSRAERGGVEDRAELSSGRTDPSGKRGSPPARLWAPWRMEFIAAPKPAGCIFCDFPAQRGDDADRRNLVAHRGARSFTVLNKYPYNSGHVMVIPRVHVATLEDLSPEEFADLHEELRLAARVVRAVYRPEGMNVGMNLGRIAGAGIVDHLHYHIVPRWGGDTNFMPVLSDTRVMVEHLEASWEKIRRGFEAA